MCIYIHIVIYYYYYTRVGGLYCTWNMRFEPSRYSRSTVSNAAMSISPTNTACATVAFPLSTRLARWKGWGRGEGRQT